MNAIEWLETELTNAKKALDAMHEGDVDREYWIGYADAITNVLNELYGPGDVN